MTDTKQSEALAIADRLDSYADGPFAPPESILIDAARELRGQAARIGDLEAVIAGVTGRYQELLAERNDAAKPAIKEVELTRSQLADVMEFAGDADGVTIFWCEEAPDPETGIVIAAGYRAMLTEYPEEGSLPLEIKDDE